MSECRVCRLTKPRVQIAFTFIVSSNYTQEELRVLILSAGSAML